VAVSGKQANFFKASAAAAGDRGLQHKLENASLRHLDHLAKARAEFPSYELERDRARRIKQDAVSRLDELLVELTRNLQARGCKVFFAAGAAEASDYIVSVAKRNNVRRAVKGKSMTTEEIGLNPALDRAGIEVVETDLGEYIVQLRGEPPSHILTPAIHLSKEDVGRLFSERFGTPYTAEPEKLTAEARGRLRAMFLGAELGITGVNFAIAETGTLVIVENEGNGRLCSSMPETLIAVMGIEKVIPKLSDLSHFLEILARTATGQKITAYTSLISGPRGDSEADGPRQMHLVIVDNGRSAMLADPVLREALYCIRCGACLNVCPVYRHIGGHAYGSPYPGPIGAIVSPPLFGSASAGHLPFASTLCGACRDVCPVRIDIPRILLHLRWKASEGQGEVKWPPAARAVRAGAGIFTRAALHPRLIRLLGRMAATVLRMFSRDGYLGWMPPPFGNWTRFRDLPAPRRRRRFGLARYLEGSRSHG